MNTVSVGSNHYKSKTVTLDEHSEQRKDACIHALISSGKRMGRASFLIIIPIMLYLLGYHITRNTLRLFSGVHENVVLRERVTDTLILLFMIISTTVLCISHADGVLAKEITAIDTFQDLVVSTPELSTDKDVSPVIYETPEEESILDTYKTLHEENADFAGWLSIPGGNIDYPVMYTPYDAEKYLHMDFEQNPDTAGTPFIDASCSLSPRSDNIIIYGHNMKDGSMFSSLLSYESEDYYKDHPEIVLGTPDGIQHYEIMAAFYDRVYYADEDVFKFYQFIDAADKSEYRNTVKQFMSKSLYNTGVRADFGDPLLTLVTCSYQTENGRFVVIARGSGINE